MKVSERCTNAIEVQVLIFNSQFLIFNSLEVTYGRE